MHMTLSYFIIFGTIALLGIVAVVMFAWAVRTGQFADFQQGATSIFDDDEPLGEMTDWFPDQHPGSTSEPGRNEHRNSAEIENRTDVDHA